MEACRILGVSGNCRTEQLKKRYRQLLHLVHPDGEIFRQRNRQNGSGSAAAFRMNEESYPYGIHEIKAAYLFLMEEKDDQGTDPRAGEDFREEDSWMQRDPEYARAVWDAEENPDAFCEREILQIIEDFDGHVLGDFTLTRGRYLWKPEEEFPLFLKSVSRAVDRLISGIEEKTEQQIYGRDRDPWMDEAYAVTESRREMLKLLLRERLTYLLAQQFIDAVHTLDQLVRTKNLNSGNGKIYYVPSMLERESAGPPVEPGETLLPDRVEHHRLYVKRADGTCAGYLSFPDDRMYYLVVPLFEQRRVQVKIRAAQPAEGSRTEAVRGRNSSRTIRISLWLKFKDSAAGMPEDISGQIRKLLEEYRNQLLNCFCGV